MSEYFWSLEQLYIEMSAHCWIPLCIQSQWSSQVHQTKKKHHSLLSYFTVGVVRRLVCVCVCASHTDKTPKILIHLVCEFQMKDSHRIDVCTFTVQSVTWDCFTLCCVLIFKFLSQCWYDVQAGAKWSWHPVSAPCVVSRGLTGLWNLCYIEAAILIYIWCYVQESRALLMWY